MIAMETDMDIEVANKGIIKEMFAATASSGLAAQANFYASDIIDHGKPATREEVRSGLIDTETAFPNVLFERLTMVAEADWVAVRCLLSGTHQGTIRTQNAHSGLLAGHTPTGRSFRVQHIHMFRLSLGKIVEHWANRDDLGMMRQLGLIRS